MDSVYRKYPGSLENTKLKAFSSLVKTEIRPVLFPKAMNTNVCTRQCIGNLSAHSWVVIRKEHGVVRFFLSQAHILVKSSFVTEA